MYVNRRSLIRNSKCIDNEIDGEREIVTFLKEILAEEKEQPMMCQHPFQHPVESALGF